MSSHHIVKDDQEPALIIANGDACSLQLTHQLLEWSPYVVVLDAAVERVLELGIKIDVLLGDFDKNFDANSYREKQYPLEIVYTPNQDKTDLEKAFDFLIEKGHKAVNVIWATGKRADHTISNLTNIIRYKNQLKIVILDDYSKVFVLPKKFEKWYPKNSIISLIPIGVVKGIVTQNLAYPLKNDELILGYKSGNSNHVLEEGIVSITHQEGDLILMECWDEVTR
ncbi:thiamine diphosphokinase [Flavobacterium croceum]|uniref:thiamine diphosphokinase n=1 Tax=Flavobacterium croceum TaxID=370975 RepID=UPI0024A97FCB|nr:thiamine diphosphokinase [Flavobacterium croceum]